MRVFLQVFLSCVLLVTISAGQPFTDFRQNNTNKVSSSTSVLVAITVENWNGTVGQKRDSTSFSFSGYRNNQTAPLVYVNIEGGQYDLRTDYKWNGNWQEMALSEQTFDNRNNLLTHSKLELVGSNWLNAEGHMYTYDSEDRLLTHVEDASERTSYVYNQSRELISMSHEQGSGSGWVTYRKELYSYSAGRLDTTVSMVLLGSSLVNESRAINTYDSNGNILSELEQTYSSGWEDDRYANYSYNIDGYKSQIIRGIFSGGVMTPTVITDFVYDSNGNDILVIQQVPDSSGWRNSAKRVSSYYPDGNIETSAIYYYNNGALELTIESIYTYNELGQVLTKDYTSYGYRTLTNYYYKTDPNGIATIANWASSVQPNPFETNVAINMTIESAGSYTFEVYSLNGQRIYSQPNYWPAGTHSFVWEGTGNNGQPVPKGMYYYKISNGKQQTTGKLLKQ